MPKETMCPYYKEDVPSCWLHYSDKCMEKFDWGVGLCPFFNLLNRVEKLERKLNGVPTLEKWR